ncbi:MAG: efflux RND transporter periplasmic adaptor subunit [Patescibacteria group bacterium]
MNLIHKILKRKILLTVIVVIIAGGGYYGYKTLTAKETATRYILGSVARGTLITSVSGSGQVDSSNQVDIKAKAAGEVLNVAVKNGQEVKTGDILAQLNAQEAQKSVRDAQANLASAKLTLEKLKKPTDSYSLMQAENSLVSARDSLEKLTLSQQTEYQKAKETKTKAEDDITKAYEDAFNAIANAFLDLPTIMTKLNDVLYSYEISVSERGTGGSDNNSMLINAVDSLDRNALQIFQTSALNDYQTADLKYDASFERYKNTSRYSDRATIESLLTEMLETTKSVAQAGKSESNYLDTWSDYRSQRQKTIFSKVTEYQTSLATYIGKINTHLSNLLSIQRTLQDDREAITNAENDIKAMDQNNPLDITAAEAAVKEKELSLADLKAGADSYDLQSQELAVRQKQNALLDAQEKLADYTARAPFDGVLATVDVKKGDSLSSGSAIATIITKQKIATISLNEVDAAKVKTGQKVTLTFDAITDLSLTGEVAEIDTIGTVTQGVVTYKVKINFDTQDDRVKPGMSVSAAIITETKTDVLTVPNSAIKTQNGSSNVEVFDQTYSADEMKQGITSTAAPRSQTVEIGIADDTATEIISGLKEGDQIVIRTVTSSSSSSTKSSSSGSSKSSTPNAGFIMGGGR